MDFNINDIFTFIYIHRYCCRMSRMCSFALLSQCQAGLKGPPQIQVCNAAELRLWIQQHPHSTCHPFSDEMTLKPVPFGSPVAIACKAGQCLGCLGVGPHRFVLLSSRGPALTKLSWVGSFWLSRFSCGKSAEIWQILTVTSQAVRTMFSHGWV